MNLIHDVNNDLLRADKAKLEKGAKYQEERIKDFFLAHPNEYYTTEDIHRLVPTGNFFSSTKRATTNLKRTELNPGGILEKCSDVKKMGSGGVMICTYIYRQQKDEQLKLVL